MGKRRILLFSIVVSVLFLLVGCTPSETNTNKPPSWKSIPEQNIKVGESVSINLLDYASDPDEDQLTFEIIAGEGNISGSTYTYSGESEGIETVTIRAKDTKGAYADTSFVINVSSGNQSGSLKWKYKTTVNWTYSSPAIGSDGTIYVGSGDSYLYAIKPDGSLKWKYKTDYQISSSPAIGSDGTIYVGSYDNYLYAINPDGSLKWKYKTGGGISSSPAIDSDGTIYVGSYKYLYAIKPDGSLRWKYGTNWSIHSSPAIGSDGTIYVGSLDNYLYAIQGESEGLADTPWPKFRNNNRNTGNYNDAE